MTSNFRFDENAIKKIANDAVTSVIPEWQRVFDSVYRTHKGKPVDEVERELKRKLGGVSRENKAAIRSVAQNIADGKRVAARPGRA